VGYYAVCQLVHYKNERDRVLRIRGIDLDDYVKMPTTERGLNIEEDEHARDAAYVPTVTSLTLNSIF
jgi:hypothetical protein